MMKHFNLFRVCLMAGAVCTILSISRPAYSENITQAIAGISANDTDKKSPSLNLSASSDYVNKAWADSGKGDTNAALAVIDEAISKYSTEADQLNATLTDFPPRALKAHIR